LALSSSASSKIIFFNKVGALTSPNEGIDGIFGRSISTFGTSIFGISIFGTSILNPNAFSSKLVYFI